MKPILILLSVLALAVAPSSSVDDPKKNVFAKPICDLVPLPKPSWTDMLPNEKDDYIEALTKELNRYGNYRYEIKVITERRTPFDSLLVFHKTKQRYQYDVRLLTGGKRGLIADAHDLVEEERESTPPKEWDRDGKLAEAIDKILGREFSNGWIWLGESTINVHGFMRPDVAFYMRKS